MYNHLDAMAWVEVEVDREMKEEDYKKLPQCLSKSNPRLEALLWEIP